MVTILMPVYNEGASIRQTLSQVEQVLGEADIPHSYLLVDDGSTDDTWQQLLLARQELPGLRLVRLSRNFGKEAALCAGLERAGGDAVIVMDADLQHPPRYLPRMVELWQQGYEIVDGVKAHRGREPFFRRWGAALYYRLFGRLTGLSQQPLSDFKLLSRRALEAWKQLPERDTYFRGMSAWLGFARCQMPFEVEPRRQGRTKWRFSALLRLFVDSIIAYTAAPLLLVGVMGLVMLAAAAVLTAQTLWMYFSHQAQTGFSTVILLQLFIGSGLMLALSVIGLYIGKIYEEVKGRPRYLVQEDTDALLPVDPR